MSKKSLKKAMALNKRIHAKYLLKVSKLPLESKIK